jgi:hypothetical protein
VSRAIKKRVEKLGLLRKTLVGKNMGVDYYVCDTCGDAFPDCSSRACWCSCGMKFCRFECGELDYSKYDENGEAIESTGYDESTCNICRHEDANDAILFLALLKHFNITREQALKIWQDQQDGEPDTEPENK